MSIPYAVAVIHGRPGVAHFESAMRADAAVRRVADLVKVRVAADCARDYPVSRRARLTVRTSGGEYKTEIDNPYGEPGNPVSDADLEAKFVHLTTPILGSRRPARIAEAIWSLPTTTALTTLTEATTPAVPH